MGEVVEEGDGGAGMREWAGCDRMRNWGEKGVLGGWGMGMGMVSKGREMWYLLYTMVAGKGMK